MAFFLPILPSCASFFWVLGASVEVSACVFVGSRVPLCSSGVCACQLQGLEFSCVVVHAWLVYGNFCRSDVVVVLVDVLLPSLFLGGVVWPLVGRSSCPDRSATATSSSSVLGTPWWVHVHPPAHGSVCFQLHSWCACHRSPTLVPTIVFMLWSSVCVVVVLKITVGVYAGCVCATLWGIFASPLLLAQRDKFVPKATNFAEESG